MFILFNGSGWCIYEDVDVVVFVCTRNKKVYFYKIIIFLVDHQPKIKIFTNFSPLSLKQFVFVARLLLWG